MLKTNTVFYFDSSDFINITHHFIDQANFSLAKKAIKMGLEQHPNNIDLMLLKSELLIFNSNYEGAYKILNFVEEIDPENREVYLQKATIYSKNNLSEEAIEILKSALSFIDDKLEIWNMIALEFLLLEDFESAIPFFKKCLDYDNEDYQSLYNLIFCYENIGMIDESIEELSTVLEKRPYSKIAWHQLGKIYNKQGKYKESISAFDFAIISDDQFVSAYIEKAKVLEKVKRYNEALENFRLSIELSEPNSFVYYRIAKCYIKINNKKLFIDFIKKSVREEPGNEKAWITDRGTMFGYQDMIVDFRGIPTMRAFAPTVLDVTHSLQQPNQASGVTGGRPEMIETIARAGIVNNVDGLFIETHFDPSNAKSDGANMLPLHLLEPLLEKLVRLREAVI